MQKNAEEKDVARIQFTTRSMFVAVAMVAVCIAVYKFTVSDRTPRCDAQFVVTGGDLELQCIVGGSSTELSKVTVFDEATRQELWMLHMPLGVRNGGALSTADRSTIPRDSGYLPAEETGSLSIGNSHRRLRVAFHVSYLPIWPPAPSAGWVEYRLDSKDGVVKVISGDGSLR